MNLWPFRHKPKPAPAQPSSDGVLFGLDPPDGCHFKVYLHKDDAWFVEIWRERQQIASDLSLTGTKWSGGVKRTDEELIKAAAEGALAQLERKAAVEALEGCYPPKRTGQGVPVESLGRAE